MKLTELNPRWLGIAEHSHSEDVDLTRCGISFDCPHCKTQRIAVFFHHLGREALEDGAILAVHAAPHAPHIWTLIGEEDFATLTLMPSIDASAAGHWHGWIKDGEVT